MINMEAIKDFLLNAWDEFVENIYANNSSISVYLLKAFFVILIYIIISDYLKRLFKKIDENLEEKNVHKSVRVLGMGGLLYVILSCLVLVMFNILVKMEVNPTVTLVVLLIIFLFMVVKGVFTKLISKLIKYLKKNTYDDYDEYYEGFTVLEKPSIFKNNNVRRVLKFCGSLILVAIAVFILQVSYRGISYMLYSGGEEISWVFDMPDNLIALKLDTKFKKDTDIVDSIPIYSNDRVTVKSDGNLNIVYVENKRIGFNTQSRDYKIYGVAINQTASSVHKKMNFFYDQRYLTVQDTYGSNSDTTYYVNTEDNICLAVTVNSTSNRVIGVSYFSDFEKATENAILSVE